MRMTVKRIRKRLLNAIRHFEKYAEFEEGAEFEEVDMGTVRLSTLIWAYNATFSITDKRVKKWKCRICGNLYSGVIKPVEYSTMPYTHWCDLDLVSADDTI